MRISLTPKCVASAGNDGKYVSTENGPSVDSAPITRVVLRCFIIKLSRAEGLRSQAPD